MSDNTTTPSDNQPEVRNAASEVFQSMNDDRPQSKNVLRELDMIRDIPVKIDVELGRTEMTIKELLQMSQGSVVELDGLAGDPMRILVNGYPIAKGEVVVVDGKYGIRITEIVTPSERVSKIHK
jgi:flagellar motor switch protein FliN/FliY